MKFKIRTMNSIYELNDIGLWQNGELYCKTEDICEVYFTKDVFGYRDIESIPLVEYMLLVEYLREGKEPRYIRTSMIKEVLEYES